MIIESPLIQEIIAERLRLAVIRVLNRRFGSTPTDVVAHLETITNSDQMDDLLDWAIQCPDLDAFRARASSLPPPAAE